MGVCGEEEEEEEEDEEDEEEEEVVVEEEVVEEEEDEYEGHGGPSCVVVLSGFAAKSKLPTDTIVFVCMPGCANVGSFPGTLCHAKL